MKLEIRHLAPYLPYELNILITESGEIVKMLSLDAFLFRNQVAIETNRGSLGSMWFKPILRPLSDLTKEIEHNGEKFTPSEKVKVIQDFENIDIMIKSGIILFCDIQQLIEWHFDIFGLIDAGLAIDINTLTN